MFFGLSSSNTIIVTKIVSIYKSLILATTDPLYYGLPATYSFKSITLSKQGFPDSFWQFFYRFSRFSSSDLKEKSNFEKAHQICQGEGAMLPIPISGK